MTRILLIACMVLGFCSQAAAQKVSYEGLGLNSSARLIRTEVDKNGPAWFPNPTAAEPDGTVIEVTNDFYNADVSIRFVKALIPQMLPKAIALVHKLGLPDTHIIIRQGRVIGNIDFEFNRYVRFDGQKTRCTMPLGMIVDDATHWGLPQPMGIAILKRSRGSFASLGGKLADSTLLLSTKDISPNAMVEVRSERHWYGLLGAVAMGCLFLGLLSTILYSVLKKKPSTPTLTVVEPVPSLIAAQAKYDQKKTGAAWKSLTPLFLVFALLILVRGPAMDDMAMWLPPASPAVIGLIPLFIFIPFLAVLVAGKRSKPKPNPVSTQFSWVLAVFIVPFVLLLLVLLIQMNAPQWLYWIPAPVLSTTVRIIGLLPLPLIAIVWLVKSKRGTLNFSENLGPGDSDYDTAIEIGALAGVKVRRVRVLNHVKSANALVGVTGTIGLTQGFRDKLSPEEKRCVIAHEIGHLKGRHVWVLLAFSLCVVGPIWFMSTKLKGPYEFLAPFVPIVLIIVPMLARSPIQRKYEYAADKFALETIGSFDEVGGALAKIHLLNAAPHTLRKFDAALSSHPSLTKRLEYLRKTANEMGLSVPEDAVQKLIEAAVLENPGDATGDSPSPSPA